MADELGTHPMLAVEPGLEREQAQHQVTGSGNAADPALAPGPHLRTHVLDRGNVLRPQLCLQADIEGRRIDADEDMGTPADHVPHQPAAQREQPRQVRERFDQAHDRQLMGVGPHLAAGRAHPWPRNAEGLDVADARAQSLEQRGTKGIPRGFAGNQPDHQRIRHAWVTLSAISAPGCAWRLR